MKDTKSMSGRGSRSTGNVLIVGCGYVGEHVARLARDAGATIFALTRSSARGEQLRAQGIAPVVGHWLEPQTLGRLPEVDWVLVSIPHRSDSTGAAPSRDLHPGDSQAALTHATGLRHLLAALPDGWRKLVYLSTTGVYGADSPSTVDELAPVAPTRIGPHMAHAAECWLAEQLPPQRYTILRLAGIYGPGRIPLAARLRQGEPLAVPREGHLNLVHVNDIARMILIVAGRTMQHPMYLFSDGQPVLRETFYQHLARLCGVSDPVFVAPDPNDSRARRAADKRVDPSLLVNETHFVYQFPDFRSGLGVSLDH